MLQNTMPADIIEASAISLPVQDEQAVAAVRQGDVARYRELVERHQRRVYAVAWSRLGDAALAEEATQEAFIRAYRNLPLLGDGAKFPAWISAIARNLAISLGLRHRRELNKRERWALEQPTVEAPAATQEEICSPEMLRQTLAELPNAHRECLVLFYLEGKSGAETAATLGITETALRMRLSRARTVLREKLEARLSESLEQLRPPSTLVPSVMAVLTTSKMKAGGSVAALLAAAFGKALPLKFIPLMAPMAGMVPAVGASWWMNRLERRNYRDPKGFRARLHRDLFRRSMLGLPVLFGVLGGGSFLLMRNYGPNVAFFLLGAIAAFSAGKLTRLLVINRTRMHLSLTLNQVVAAMAMLALSAGWLPLPLFWIVMMPMALMMAWIGRDRPLRMDYNLFLRASQGLLPAAPAPAPAAAPLSKPQWLRFARFLCSRFLVNDFRWAAEGLWLRLPPAAPSFFNNAQMMFSLSWRHCSQILLRWDGTVMAELRERDERAIRKLAESPLPSLEEQEQQVAGAVEQAWRHFAAGQVDLAEHAVGQLPELEVFKIPAARARTRVWILGMMMAAGLVGFSLAGLHTSRQMERQHAAQPLQEQFHRDGDEVHRILTSSQTLLQQVKEWESRKETVLAQAESAVAEEAEKLRQQAEELQAKIADGRTVIDQNHQKVIQLLNEEKQLQLEINKVLHLPPPPADYQTPFKP
jgi:RNA polymerase sigma-70 factor (ECF subfamily)